jgi:hypothetical protein
MIFFNSFENRVAAWVSLRNEVETHADPLNCVLNFWNKAPLVNRTCDPFDQTTWLDPWQLIEANNYCDFSKVLAIYYTLALTERFKESYFEIQIAQDCDKQEMYYLLIVDNFVIGYDSFNVVERKELAKTLTVQNSYVMDLSKLA